MGRKNGVKQIGKFIRKDEVKDGNSQSHHTLVG